MYQTVGAHGYVGRAASRRSKIKWPRWQVSVSKEQHPHQATLIYWGMAVPSDGSVEPSPWEGMLGLCPLTYHWCQPCTLMAVVNNTFPCTHTVSPEPPQDASIFMRCFPRTGGILHDGFIRLNPDIKDVSCTINLSMSWADQEGIELPDFPANLPCFL